MPIKKDTLSRRMTGNILCLVILAAALTSAGCTGPFPTTNTTGPGPMVLPGTETHTVPDECSFDREMEVREIRQPGLDSCYFATHTPVEFLNDLRTHPDRPVLILNAPAGWITAPDVRLLIQQIDSPDPAAPVVSPVSSYWPTNESSTIGNEALFLIEGYRAGRYPPALCSVYYFRPNRTEVRSWWNTYGEAGLPDERAAVRAVQDVNPDLRAYPTDTTQ